MNFQEKIDKLTQLISEDSDNDEAYFKRAELYFRQKEYDKALQDYQTAYRVNPEYGLAIIAQGYLLAFKGDQAFTQALNEALLLYPDESDAHHWIMGIQDLSQSLSEGDETPSQYNQRGIKLADLGLFWLAIEDYSKAIQIDEKYSYAYYNRGLAYNDVEEHQLAIEDFTKSITLDPNDPWGYNDRGNSYNSLKQYDKAIADYKQGLEQDPEIDALYNNLADVYFTLEDFDKSVHYFKEAIKRNPTEATYLITLAEVYICMHAYDRATQMLDNHQELIDTSEYKLVAQILSLLLHTIYQQATNELEKVLRLAQQMQIDTQWNFDNLIRWWEKNQVLAEDVRKKIKGYLDIVMTLE